MRGGNSNAGWPVFARILAASSRIVCPSCLHRVSEDFGAPLSRPFCLARRSLKRYPAHRRGALLPPGPGSCANGNSSLAIATAMRSDSDERSGSPFRTFGSINVSCRLLTRPLAPGDGTLHRPRCRRYVACALLLRFLLEWRLCRRVLARNKLELGTDHANAYGRRDRQRHEVEWTGKSRGK